MSDFDPKRLYDFSVKLCAAVKKHKCLYDRISLHKNSPPECQIAWQNVAKECEETIDACKNRWKGLLKSFFQGLKRRGARYYLHEHMEFLLEGKTKGKGKRKTQSTSSLSINDDTNSVNSLQPSLDEDLSQQESLMDTINLEDDEEESAAAGGDANATADDSDSHTTSADESNELNNSREHITVGGVEGVGGFIIDEIGEEADEDRKRLSYKRACKRGLDPEIINDLEEEEPGEKRTRRSVTETRKSLPQELEDKTNSLSNKKLQVRVDKIKLNKPGIVGSSNNDNKTEAKGNNQTEAKVDDNKMAPKPLNEEVNRKKYFPFQTKDSSTQYDMAATNFDDIFLDSIKTQLQQMNPRQKMNFKRKIYESLLEVFDDNTDFPSANDVLKVPPKTNPKLLNTTVGELRLMRELVSLVQAAKNTPEIINNKEKVKISNALSPSKPTTSTAPAPTPATAPAANAKPNITDNRSKTSITSPLSLSPSLDDDDDLQFSLDNIDDDDDLILPKSWDEIKLKPTNDSNSSNNKSKPQITEDNVMGLPKRVLQKVVRVAGTSGSTIVARDGDKKRIYRIYPKTSNGMATTAANGKSGNNVGTFFVGTPKTGSDSNKSQTSLPSNFTIRTLQNKSANNSAETIISSNNNTPQTSTTMSSGNKTANTNHTVFKNVHPANRILSSSTGHFKMVPYSKTPTTSSSSKITTTSSPSTAANTNINSTTITRVTASKSPMMPPNLPISKRTVQIRTHVNTPQLMQRRYSICGPLPSEKSPAASPKAFIINKPTEKSSTSQIQISQPVSLNTKAYNNPPTTTSTNTSTTSKQNNFSSPKIPTNPTTNTSTPTAPEPLPAPIVDLVDVKPIKSLEIPLESPNPIQPLTTAIQATEVNPTEEIPILETAGTIGADNLDPLFVKPPQIKDEPLED